MPSKYLEFTKRAFIRSIEYRAEIFLWFLLDLLPFVVLFLVWLSIYTDRSTIQGVSLPQVLQFYFLVVIVSSVTDNHFEEWRVREVREGKIDFFLIRPFSYILELLLTHLGDKLLGMSIRAIMLVFAYIALQAFFPLNLPSVSAPELAIFTALLVMAFAIQTLLGLLIVLAGFWLDNASSLVNFKWLGLALFGGSLVPLPLLPGWLRSVVLALPLKYVFAMPVGVIQRTQVMTGGDWLYLTAFIAGLALVARFIWHRALVKYSSAGG